MLESTGGCGAPGAGVGGLYFRKDHLNADSIIQATYNYQLKQQPGGWHSGIAGKSLPAVLVSHMGAGLSPGGSTSN